MKTTMKIFYIVTLFYDHLTAKLYCIFYSGVINIYLLILKSNNKLDFCKYNV